MYNTNFKVKYHDIKEELTWKLKNKTPEELENNPDPEYEYSNQDILDICDKLYIDELASVFYADNFLDDKVDIGARYILEKMMDNNDFKTIVNEAKQTYLPTLDPLDSEKQCFMENADFIIILSFFQKEFFYIFHKCICQQLTLGNIDAELLNELKNIVIVS
jgi:hypothetical protein